MVDHTSQDEFDPLLEQYYACLPAGTQRPDHGEASQISPRPEPEAQEPARKKRRMKRVECDICNNEVAINQFPKISHQDATSHPGRVCYKCWEQHLQAEIDNKPWDQVSCPQCDKTLVEQEIRRLASSTGSWLDKAAKHCRDQNEEFRACPSAECSWGCFMSTREDGNIFVCQMCKYRYCIICEARMHEDETCEAYQERLKTEQDQQKRTEENLLSEAEVKKISKPCPQCGRNLDKYTGCDHVTCIYDVQPRGDQNLTRV